MGTLKELLDYIHGKSGIQVIQIIYNNEIAYDGLSNTEELKQWLDKQVAAFKWSFRYTNLAIIVRDELP